MKKLIAGLVMAALALTGCNTSTSSPSGTTGTSSPRTSSYPPPNDVGRPPVAGEPGRAPVAADTNRAPAATEPGRGAAPTLGSNEPFKLRGPGVLGMSDVTLKQGEKKEIKVGVSRSSDFKEGVRLEVKNAPKGLTVTPEKPDVPAGDDHVLVTVEASKEAPLGVQKVDLAGTADNGKGPEQTLQLKVNVEKGGEGK